MWPEALIRSVTRMGVAKSTSDEDQIKLMNNRQNGRRRGRGGQQPRNGQPTLPERGSRLDNRARGNAAQLLEKYKSLARDAQMVGDRVNTEYYLQFADHYFRVLSENRSRFEDNRPDQRRRDEYRDEFGRDGDDQGDGDELAADDEVNGMQPPRQNGWSGQEPDAADLPSGGPRRDRASREQAELPPRAVIADEGERFQERRPRRTRAPRIAEAGATEANGNAPPERIEAERLPQGFGTAPTEAAPADEAAPPRRRAPRRPRAETTTVEV